MRKAVMYLFAILILLMSNVASADVITYNFGGEVSDVTTSSLNSLIGITVMGSFTYDSDSADLNPGDGGYYSGISLNFIIDSFSASTSNLSIAIVNDGDDGGGSTYDKIQVYGSAAFTPNSYDSYIIDSFELVLVDTTATVLNNDSLPTILPALSSFDVQQFNLNFEMIPLITATAYGDIEYLIPVPEPSTMLLLSSGLLGLWGLRRKVRK